MAKSPLRAFRDHTTHRIGWEIYNWRLFFIFLKIGGRKFVAEKMYFRSLSVWSRKD
jgi:hypothetical protein